MWSNHWEIKNKSNRTAEKMFRCFFCFKGKVSNCLLEVARVRNVVLVRCYWSAGISLSDSGLTVCPGEGAWLGGIPCEIDRVPATIPSTAAAGSPPAVTPTIPAGNLPQAIQKKHKLDNNVHAPSPSLTTTEQCAYTGIRHTLLLFSLSSCTCMLKLRWALGVRWLGPWLATELLPSDIPY